MNRPVHDRDSVSSNVRWTCDPFARLVEDEYLKAGQAVWLRIGRNILVLSALLALIMNWAAALSSSDLFVLSMALHGLVSLPVAVAAAALSYRIAPGRLRETLFGGAAMVLMASLLIQAQLAKPDYANRYVMAAVLDLFVVLIVMPLRLRASALVALAGAAMLVASVSLSSQTGAARSLDIVVFAILSVPLCLRVRIGIEQDQRSLFLLRRHERTQREELERAVSQLKALSYTDPLTGIANRRSFESRIGREMAAASGAEVGLIMIDVDHFKPFNDRFGHSRGDECLRLVASTIEGQLLDGRDLAARIGGEEFAVLLPGYSRAGMLAVAERVRAAIEALKIDHPSRPAPPPFVTASLGVAVGHSGMDADELVERADRALYAAKQRGRNGVVLYDATLASASPDAGRFAA